MHINQVVFCNRTFDILPKNGDIVWRGGGSTEDTVFAVYSVESITHPVIFHVFITRYVSAIFSINSINESQ